MSEVERRHNCAAEPPLSPSRPETLHASAHLALMRGEAEAADLYARALRQNPGDPELILGLASALAALGDPRGVALLAQSVDLSPGWVAGHEELARMRAEAGESKGLDRSYREALAKRPGDRALHISHWAILSRAGQFQEALRAIDFARARLAEDRQLLLIEANIATEAGDRARADCLFERLGEDKAALPIRGWHALRCGEPKLAADLLWRLTREHPGQIAAWADLDLAWRLTGDPRHEWLSGQQGFYGAIELDLAPGGLPRLAELLRGLHRTFAHPIGQSLRGGTQTRGRLLARPEPEIAALREAIDRALLRHITGLPGEDATHPLLRHRNRSLAVKGSWSVRLAGGGFHVSHIHPEGIFSSACYISLPPSVGSSDSRDGWLELGRPPVELGLTLEPLVSIRPEPGHLVLFPSYLYHGTRAFGKGERLSVAFDIVPR